MNKLLLFIISVVFATISNAQGLKGIIVERYYVADDTDSKAAGEKLLPEESVTYRIFVDMQPGYKFQAVFGSQNHPLKIATSTSFYNNSILGSYIPNLIYDLSLRNNTTMVDSWISVGAASQNHIGVLKQYDDTIATVINNGEPPVLQNDDISCGIPISVRDGMTLIPAPNSPPKVTALNIDSLLTMLTRTPMDANGMSFETENGSWACIESSANDNGKVNQILIGQFTTNGIFSYELNIQLAKPSGGFEQYVAKNPDSNQLTSPQLTFSSSDTNITSD